MPNLLDKLKSALSNGAANLIEKAGEALDKNITNKEELIKAKTEQEKVLNDFTFQMAENSLKHFEAELRDVESARDREIAIATSDKAPLINKIILPCMAIGVTIGFFTILLYMLKYEVPKDNERILDIMLGSLGTAWIGIVFYYFGSSQGSAQKQIQIEKLTK